MLKKLLCIILSIFSLTFSLVSCSSEEPEIIAEPDYGVNFYEVYSSCGCASPWAENSYDYLYIDTNPYNYDSDTSGSTKYLSDAISAIRAINTKLNLPSYLADEMLQARSLDGKQTYDADKVSVSWRYHPDSGLEVRYTKK